MRLHVNVCQVGPDRQPLDAATCTCIYLFICMQKHTVTICTIKYTYHIKLIKLLKSIKVFVCIIIFLGSGIGSIYPVIPPLLVLTLRTLST